MIKKILTYSVYILAPALLVFLNIIFRTAQGERAEEVLAGILLGTVFDFLYAIALGIIKRRSKAEMWINVGIAALLFPAVAFWAIGVLTSAL